MTPRRDLALAAGLLALLAPSACVAVTEESSRTAPTEGDGVSYPLTIDNCGHEVTIEEPPERLLLLESAPVAALDALGQMDKVVSRAGAFPKAYYSEQTNELIDDIPSLGETTDESGHLLLSQEAVIAEAPDLVLGIPDGITRESLNGAGIEVLEQEVYCKADDDETTFDDVYAQVELYGEIFDQTDKADAVIAELEERVEQASDLSPDGENPTAAVLFPIVGSGAGYAYGSLSMAHPQIEAAGFTNAFEDIEERVFEVALEEVIARNPDVLVLLHVDGEPEPVKDTITSLPGAGDLAAVQNDDILVQFFNFTEPPTPLSVDGLERIAEEFGSR